MGNKKLKFWKWTALLLLALNLGLISLMIFKPGHHRGIPPHEWVNFLSNELEFSDQQREKLSVLDEQHHNRIKGFMEEGKKLRNQFFQGIKESEVSDSILAARAQKIAYNQQQIEVQTFHHFKQVRSLCNQEQINKFDKVMFDALKRMGPPPPPKK